MEEYLDIKGYEGIYQVSNLGNVKSIKRIIMRSDGRPRTINERIRVGPNNKGYKRVSIVDLNGISLSYYVHRLVAFAFLGESDLYVDHIDGNRANNNLENLRYVTNSQNLTFRNTEKKFKSPFPYVCYDHSRKTYRVKNKRYHTLDEAISVAKCLLGQLQ